MLLVKLSMLMEKESKWNISHEQKEYKLLNFERSNLKTTMHQVPVVSVWQKVAQWDLLAEWPCAVDGEMALGKYLKLPLCLGNDTIMKMLIVISQRLVRTMNYIYSDRRIWNRSCRY